MTREDEILSAASDHRDLVCCGFIDFVADARRDSFAEGAKWADKTMIERICNWLLNIDYDSLRYRDFGEEFNEELFVNDLRRVMEE